MVEWHFLFIILDKMGFLREFNDIARLMFVNVKVSIKIKNSLSKPFMVKRGVR